MMDSHFSRRKLLILNMIHAIGPISRTALTSLTDYRPGTVGKIVTELLEEKLVVETGLHSAGQGRKRVMLEINQSELIAIGISFMTNEAVCLATQIDGSVICQNHIPIAAGLPKEEMVAKVATTVLQMQKGPLADKNVIGVGICYPLYDPTAYHTEHPLLTNYATYNDWIDTGLVPELQRITNIPVRTFSAVSVPVIAEQSFGVAKGAKDFICVELSNGFGSSICCNGSPVLGASGFAGEIGHTVMDISNPNPRLCYCGKPGCVETLVAYPALANELRSALQQGVLSSLHSVFKRTGSFTVQDIRKALDEGDRMCLYYVRRAATRIGIAIANAVNLLNPEMVVLYGFMVELGDTFLTEVERAIRDNSLSLSQNFVLRVSAASKDIRPLGAAAELFASFLHRDDFKWIYQMKNEDWEEFASSQKEDEQE